MRFGHRHWSSSILWVQTLSNFPHCTLGVFKPLDLMTWLDDLTKFWPDLTWHLTWLAQICEPVTWLEAWLDQKFWACDLTWDLTWPNFGAHDLTWGLTWPKFWACDLTWGLTWPNFQALHPTRLGVCRPCDKRSEGMCHPARTCYPELQGSMYGLGETYIQIACHRVLKSFQGYKKNHPY